MTKILNIHKYIYIYPHTGILTVDIHSDRLNCRWAEAIFSLAVIASTLVPLDLSDVKCLIKDTWILKTVWHTACCLSPSNLPEKQEYNKANHQRNWNHISLKMLGSNKKSCTMKRGMCVFNTQFFNIMLHNSIFFYVTGSKMSPPQ